MTRISNYYNNYYPGLTVRTYISNGLIGASGSNNNNGVAETENNSKQMAGTVTYNAIADFNTCLTSGTHNTSDSSATTTKNADGSVTTIITAENSDGTTTVTTTTVNTDGSKTVEIADLEKNGNKTCESINKYDKGEELTDFYKKNYDSKGHIKSESTTKFVNEKLADSLHIIYNQNGHIIQIQHDIFDNNGKIKEMNVDRYDDSGKKISADRTRYREDGSISTFDVYSFSDNGNVKFQTSTYYDENGNVKGRTVFNNNEQGKSITTLSYDSNNHLTSRFEYKYDSDDNKIGKTDFYYDENGKLKLKSEIKTNNEGINLGNVDTFYDSDGNVTRTTIYKNDEKGNPVEIIFLDADGKRTNEKSYSYDEKGNCSGEKEYYYTYTGNVILTQSTIVRDKDKNIIRREENVWDYKTSPVTSVTSVYDSNDRKTEVRIVEFYNDGHAVWKYYESNGNITSCQDRSENKVDLKNAKNIKFDADGYVISYIDSKGKQKTYKNGKWVTLTPGIETKPGGEISGSDINPNAVSHDTDKNSVTLNNAVFKADSNANVNPEKLQ